MEIWANIKNWVLAHIGNGTLTIKVNGQTYTFTANQSTNVTIDLSSQGEHYYGISASVYRRSEYQRILKERQ